jgi:Protein of unknown function (DUF3631)
METVGTYGTDPYQIDPLDYLADLNGNLSAAARQEHYRAIRMALWRLQREDPVAFDLALAAIKKVLKIGKGEVRKDLKLLTDPPAAKEARELLDRMGQTRPLHLAQDFVDGKLWFGVLAGDARLVVNSDRQLFLSDKLPEGLTPKGKDFDICRLSKEAIERFLDVGPAADAALLDDLRRFFARFVVFPDPRLPLLLATWTLGTYCYRVFRVFPYLGLRSPEKRCGKSRVLDILRLLAFNASNRVSAPTAPQIFRGPARNGGTLLLDEVEALGGTDQKLYGELIAVLNNGYEQGGSVSRLEPTAAGGYQEVTYEIYAPRAYAGIRKVADTLEDRSILIVMQRKLAHEPTDHFSPPRLEGEAQALRNRCYPWALAHAADLAKTYEQADHFFAPYLSSLDDRAQDLWEPLASIAAVADVERGDQQKTLTEELTALARDLCQLRDGAAEDSDTVRILRALEWVVSQERQSGLVPEGADVRVDPTKLARLLKEQLEWPTLSPKGLVGRLRPLGFVARSTNQRGKIVRAYHLSEQALAELGERYGQNGATE